MWTWLNDRFPLSGLIAWLRDKSVPVHRYAFAYGLGGAIMFLFAVSCVTGVMLALFYVPSGNGAYESVGVISTQVPFGSLIRSLHHWAAHLSIALAFIHLMLKWLLKAYRKPRELTWITGCVLLACWLAAGFTGYLLPWDVLSVAATKVGTGMAALLPVVGNTALVLLRGGADVTEGTLPRFYIFHVFVIPAAIFLVLCVHVLLIQAQGMSVPVSVEKEWASKKRSHPFFPDFVLREGIIWLCLLGVLVTLAALIAPEARAKADLMAPAETGIKPEWYFLFMFQTLKLMPSLILTVPGDVIFILVAVVVAVLLLALPFLDRRSARGLASPVFTGLAVLAMIYFAVMTAWSLAPTSATEPAAPAVAVATADAAPAATPVVAPTPPLPEATGHHGLWLALTWTMVVFLIVVLGIRIRDLNRLRDAGL
jgi:cytochrome b6